MIVWFLIYWFIYNFNWITQYNSTLTSMPSRGKNCYLLLLLILISRSPLWLGSNIIAFYPGGPSLIPDIILIYALFLIVKVISSIILISFILFIHIYVYIISNWLSTPVVPWLSCSPLDLRFAGSNPARVDGFFQSVKILSMTSFGREVKPLVLCHRFTACKRISSRN